MISFYRLVIFVLYFYSTLCFRLSPLSSTRLHQRRLVIHSSSYVSDADFNPSDYITVLKSANPLPDVTSSADTVNLVDPSGKADQTYRKYPYDNLGLQVLRDCNNYYSGNYGEFFWHQNADQVMGFYPLSDPDIDTKRDVHADFQVNHVKLTIKDQVILDVDIFDKIIPAGSFWVLEKDAAGKMYIQLDLEKRLRMINWNGFLLDKSRDAKNDDYEKKNELLKKLFAANKGMSKVTGSPAETIEEMMQNEELMKRISGEVNTMPRVVDADGNDDTNVDPMDLQRLYDEIGELNLGSDGELESNVVDTTAVESDVNVGSE